MGQCLGDSVWGTVSLGQCLEDSVCGTVSGGQCLWDRVWGTVSGGQCLWNSVWGTVSVEQCLEDCLGDSVCGTVSLILFDLIVHGTKLSTNSPQRPVVVTKFITRKQTCVVSQIKWHARWTSGSALRRFLSLHNADGLWILVWSCQDGSTYTCYSNYINSVWTGIAQSVYRLATASTGPGIKSSRGRIFSRQVQTCPVAIRPPAQWVPGHSRGLERLERWVHHPPQSSAEFKERAQLWSLLAYSRASFTFTLHHLTANSILYVSSNWPVKQPDS